MLTYRNLSELCVKLYRTIQGEPEQKGAPDETSFSVEKAVPSLTVTLRIEPHTDEMKKAPKYSSGTYALVRFRIGTSLHRRGIPQNFSLCQNRSKNRCIK